MRLAPEIEAIHARCDEVGTCWLWKGALDGHGRPQKRHQGKTVYVRRLVRELADGAPVPQGREVAAKCGCKLCVSPWCSVLATPRQRAQMAAARGSFSAADKMAKMVATKRARSAISDATVASIRAATGPSREIAQATGVSVSHVKAIRRGDARRDWTTNPFAGLLAANDREARRA